MYVVVFFLLLWVLCQVISSEARCVIDGRPRDDAIYLLQTSQRYIQRYMNNNLINNEFKTNLKNSGYQKTGLPIILLRGCSSKLMENIKDTQHLRYVVHLQVEDFYQNNYNDVIKLGYSWAGDLEHSDLNKEVPVCRRNENRTKNGRATCDPSSEIIKPVKIVSNEVMSLKYLYEQIVQFPNTTEYQNVYYKIWVCPLDYTRRNVKRINLYFKDVKINIVYNYTDKCNRSHNISDDVIAILAPTSTYVLKTHKPVIFYEEPYGPNTAAFYKNPVRLVRDWKPFARTILALMTKNGWSRIAVLSDDTVESGRFEQELRMLFDKNDISYVVMTVPETKGTHNFSEVLHSLKRADARIIIANVDKQHADILGQQAKENQLTISQKVLWIARDWSTPAVMAAVQGMETVINVFPRISLEEYYIDRLNMLFKRLQQRFLEYDFRNTNKFANQIRIWLSSKSYNDHIYIRETQKHGGYPSIIAVFLEGQLRITKSFANINDRQDDCSMTSPNYYKPCDDWNVIYIMLVVMVFAVTVLGLTFFFQTTDISYNRM